MLSNSWELVELIHEISLQLGGDGAVLVKRLPVGYADVDPTSQILLYEASCQCGGVSRGQTATKALLGVLSNMEGNLRSHRDDLANNLHTVDRLLSAVDSLKDDR